MIAGHYVFSIAATSMVMVPKKLGTVLFGVDQTEIYKALEARRESLQLQTF
jgi:hypothetical protein